MLRSCPSHPIQKLCAMQPCSHCICAACHCACFWLQLWAPLCAAAFIFFNFMLSIAATVFALKAVEEIKAKQREEYNRLSVLSDTLQYEVDQ